MSITKRMALGVIGVMVALVSAFLLLVVGEVIDMMPPDLPDWGTTLFVFILIAPVVNLV